MRFVSKEEFEAALNTMYDAVESGQVDPAMRETSRADFIERKMRGFKDGAEVRDELLLQIKADRAVALDLISQIKEARERLSQIEATIATQSAVEEEQPLTFDEDDQTMLSDDEDEDRRP